MKMKFKELNKIKIKNKMGQKQTKQSEYFIPTTKNFKISYCVQETITELVEKKEYIDLSKILQEYSTLNLVLQVLYYKCKHQGYNFKEFNVIPISYRIDHILEYISDKGILLSNNAVINDINIIRNCYQPKLNNIYHFLNKGNILIGGIILNEIFISQVLKMDLFEYYDIISDIILIVGYDSTSIYLKTTWSKELIKMDNKFVKNIREIWDIEIETIC